MSDEAQPIRKLNPRQRDFVEQYLLTLNATEAAIAAGYPAKSARSKGSQLLANVNIAAEIQERRKAKSEKIGVTQEVVLTEASAILLSNITDVVEINAEGIDFRKDISETAKKAIKKITFVNEYSDNDRGTKSTTRISVEMHCKIKMIEFFAGHLDMKTGGGNAGGNSADEKSKSERILAAVRRVAGLEE